MKLKNSVSLEKLTQRRYPRTEDIRGPFFRDVTAIIHSYPYRRLKHKTQVFFAPQNDHICTRIEHVMHVATISVTICKALGLDSDLAWAISVGHDLGHTPFGHTGESIISKKLEKLGGFCHEMNSLRVVDHLVDNGEGKRKGLNLTFAVRDGIVNHGGEKFEQFLIPSDTPCEPENIKSRSFLPCTWEGIAVRTADKIAYLGRDLEDAIRLGMLRKNDIPENVRRNLGMDNSGMINTMVYDVVGNARNIGRMGFSDRVYEALKVLKKFNYENIYHSSRFENYHKQIELHLGVLWDYFSEVFDKYGFSYGEYEREDNNLALEFAHYLEKMEEFYKSENEPLLIVSDYIAGMTDKYAIDSATELISPRRFNANN